MNGYGHCLMFIDGLPDSDQPIMIGLQSAGENQVPSRQEQRHTKLI